MTGGQRKEKKFKAIIYSEYIHKYICTQLLARVGLEFYIYIQYAYCASRWQRQHMLPLQFSAAPKLFPSFDDYCKILHYQQSMLLGLHSDQIMFKNLTEFLVQPIEYETDPYFLQLSQYIATDCLLLCFSPFLPEFTCFVPKMVLF